MVNGELRSFSDPTRRLCGTEDFPFDDGWMRRLSLKAWREKKVVFTWSFEWGRTAVMEGGPKATWGRSKRPPKGRCRVGEGAFKARTDEMGMEGKAFATLPWWSVNLAVPVWRGRRQDVERRFGTTHVPC